MSGSTKSGLIFGVVQFFVNIGIGIIFPICGLVLSILWGAGAGYMAIRWSPPMMEGRARGGATAGAISAIGAYLGLVIGMAIAFGPMGGSEVASSMSAQIAEVLGTDPSAQLPGAQWIGMLCGSCCFGLLYGGILAGAGALTANFAGKS
jgi:hypothetical protein